MRLKGVKQTAKDNSWRSFKLSQTGGKINFQIRVGWRVQSSAALQPHLIIAVAPLLLFFLKDFHVRTFHRT